MPICTLSQASYSSLQGIYDSLNGNNWIYANISQRWQFPSSPSAPCSVPWQGVQCVAGINAICNVSTLTLESMNLTGNLPSHLPSGLVRLSMGDNNILGTLPSQWGELTTLTAIFLTTNSMSGNLPNSWSMLQNLQFLELSVNNFNGSFPNSWSAMSNLQMLILNNNRLSGSITAIWRKMTQLALSSQYLTGSLPESWSEMTNLQELYLSQNNFVGQLPKSWSVLTNLEIAYMFHNSFSGSLPSVWSTMTNLELIALGTNSLHGTLPESWSSMVNMEILDISSNSLVGTLPSSWSTMSFLNLVYLNDNMLSGRLPSSWSTLKIGIMFAYNNMFTGPLPPSWSTMDSMQLFNSVSNMLSGTLPASYSAWSNILVFNVSENNLEGSIPPTWCQISSLLALYLDSNGITGTLDACWNGILYLSVSDNWLTSVNVKGLHLNSSSLQLFDVSNNDIQQDIKSLLVLFDLPSFNMFDISSNRFTGKLMYPYNPTKQNSVFTVETIDVSDNCLSRDIDKSVCMLNSLTTFLASNIHHSFKCSVGSNSDADYAYPSCLLTLPKMETINLIGNAMTGTLVDIDVSSSRLSFVGLVSNRITGALPKSWQKYGRFDQLLLSFNKISGVLDSDFAVRENMTNLNMSLNRLSGKLPSSFSSLSHMDVIDGNIISCDSQSTYVNGNDANKNSYECGSRSLNVVGFLCVTCAGCLFISYSIEKTHLDIQLKSLFLAIKSQIRDNLVLVSVLLACALLMLLIVLSMSLTTASMFSIEYSWVTTTAFLHGSACVAILLVSCATMLIVIFMVGTKYDVDSRIPTNTNVVDLNAASTSPVDATSSSASSFSADNLVQVLQLIGLHIVNVVWIGGLTVIYVLIVLTSSSSTGQLLYSIFLGLMKVLWGKHYINYMFRFLIFRRAGVVASDVAKIATLYPIVLRQEMIAETWCFLLCPLIVIITTSSTCFKYLISGVPNVSVTLSEVLMTLQPIVPINSNNASAISYGINNVPMPYTSTESFTVNPPWLYSYQCSSAITTSYSVVVYYSYIMYCIIPYIKLFQCKYLSGLFPILTDVVLPSTAAVDTQAVHDRVSLASISVTSTRHRTHIRHYVMFLIFGLASPPLAMLILATIVLEDAMFAWEMSELREALITCHGMSEEFAKEQCNRLLLQDVCNVYHRYLPWVSLIAVGYWALYAFDSIGDVHGTYNGMIASVTYVVCNLVFIVIVYYMVGKFQLEQLRIFTMNSKRIINTSTTDIVNILLTSVSNKKRSAEKPDDAL